MNNQVNLIDGNKIKEWLEERANAISQEQAKTQDADRFQFLNGEYYFIKELLVLINYDKFTIYTPPVPTIKPGDTVYHNRFKAQGKVKKLSASGKRAYVVWFDGYAPSYVSLDSLEVVE
jgi:hypothetical protein